MDNLDYNKVRELMYKYAVPTDSDFDLPIYEHNGEGYMRVSDIIEFLLQIENIQENYGRINFQQLATHFAVQYELEKGDGK